jgi:hypothetical protein
VSLHLASHLEALRSHARGNSRVFCRLTQTFQGWSKTQSRKPCKRLGVHQTLPSMELYQNATQQET